MPRYSGWSFEMTSARRQAAITGTWRSSAKRRSSVEVRARRTPPPARITGRRALASSSMTAASSSGVARGTPGRSASARSSSTTSSSRSSGSDSSTGPGRPDSASRTACAMTPGTSSARRGSAAHLARPPMVATWSISWKASRPWNARSTWPTSANIGLESWRAVWIPMARLALPTARVPRLAAGRPVSCPWASAMNAAPPSWRVATTRIPASANASSRPRNDSPGTVNAYRTPAARRPSAMNRPTVRAGRAPAAGSGSGSARLGLGRLGRLGLGGLGLGRLGLGSASGSAASGSAARARPPRAPASVAIGLGSAPPRGVGHLCVADPVGVGRQDGIWLGHGSDRPSCGGSVCQRDGDGGEDEPEDDHGRDDQHHGLGETRSGHGGPTGSSRTGAGPARPARAAGR